MRILEQMNKDEAHMIALVFVFGYSETYPHENPRLETIIRTYQLYRPYVQDLCTVIEFVKLVWSITNQFQDERKNPYVDQDKKTENHFEACEYCAPSETAYAETTAYA